ncbi:MAG: glycoside hydrolase family 130 protein [Ignavibacteria bacterium]|jgi:predicted GH43/DUF377 family glycosyl hydrolase
MKVERLNIKFDADPRRVILQFFEMNEEKTINIINRILSLDEDSVKQNLEKVFTGFSHRHKNFDKAVLKNYSAVEKYIEEPGKLSRERQQLIGTYFSKEYSIESAALFNPSIVPHPDQDGAGKGELKFVMSLRATGEGHISSVEFREGIITDDYDVRFINESAYSTLPTKYKLPIDGVLDKKMNLTNGNAEDLAKSNYKACFDDNSKLSERVLFPNSPSESMGLEDVRFVKFNDNGNSKYYGTYTAYNGKTFGTQIIETHDFKNFEIRTLHGKKVKDKGMALFPRKISGQYVMTSRQDGENLFLMKSDNLYNWNESELLLKPGKPWEFIQLGNCGSPIETEKGWLLITHAVGVFRRYVISAVRLDLENPLKVIASLDEPLIEPNEDEREGYVPNVVYSCGSLVHNKVLIIPYAMSDSSCGFARVQIDDLLNKMS